MNPDFADGSKWSMVVDRLIVAQRLSDREFIPIPPISLNGFALNFRYLRVAANNQNAKSSWRLGGWLEFLVNEMYASVRIDQKVLACNRAVIIEAPSFVDTYQIKVAVPYWFDEISLQVEGYTG